MNPYSPCNWEHPGLAQSAPEPGPQDPKRVRKESESLSRGLRQRGAPESPKSGPRTSKKSPKTQLRTLFWTLFGLRGARFGDSGAPRGRRPGTPLRARRAQEPGRGVPNPVSPYPLNFGVADSPPGVSETPCFTVCCRGYGLTGQGNLVSLSKGMKVRETAAVSESNVYCFQLARQGEKNEAHAKSLDAEAAEEILQVHCAGNPGQPSPLQL